MPRWEQNTLVKARELLRGAYDLHIHTAPSPFDRLLDDFGLLKEAGDAGMAGIMLKSHYESTAARAQLVNTHGGSSAKAYGGIVLNWPTGGLNPYAVENALKRGGRMVWMPTRDSRNSLYAGDMPGDFFAREGIAVMDEQGKLKSSVLEIMDVVKKYDAALATGHLSREESVALCREGTARGVRMVLTHPEFDRTMVDPGTQKELAQLGVYIEKCWYNIGEGNCTGEQMARHIRLIGAEHCFMCTDRGQGNREHPVEEMVHFIAEMLHQGLTEGELLMMLRKVPEQVLGIQ